MYLSSKFRWLLSAVHHMPNILYCVTFYHIQTISFSQPQYNHTD